MKKKIVTLLAVVMLMMGVSTVGATLYNFTPITSNSGQQVAVGAQLSMDVTDSSGNVSFLFKNNVGIASTVQQIYFADLSPAWLTFSSMVQSSGVVFGSDSATPADLSAGNTIGFTSSYGYDADKTNNPNVSQILNGINNSTESLEIIFALNNTHTFSEIISALNDGTFRVGVHVQAIGTSDESDSFVNTPNNPVPEPGTMLLLGMGIFGMAIYGKRRMHKES